METQQDLIRIKALYKMLLEMATGNLAFRIAPDRHGDKIEELGRRLNKIAEEMQEMHGKPQFHNILFGYNVAAKTRKPSDADLIRNVLQYILNHLEDPLPTTKELSKMFQTNEFTLKDSFRNTVKTSIYQFYNEERLKKAYFLIQQSEIPLKEIALICGFNDYPNFYKAFKKRYGYPPSELTRE
jgi:transcriptional regulator GlxA family with amidase domain